MEHLNSKDVQPPVNCPLLIEVEGKLVRAHRENWELSKESEMEFILPNGDKLVGRYRWTYP